MKVLPYIELDSIFLYLLLLVLWGQNENIESHKTVLLNLSNSMIPKHKLASTSLLS